MSGWTPGPWRTLPNYSRRLIEVKGEGGERVASLFPFAVDKGVGAETADANAKLIAAAPEMVELLRRLVPATRTDEDIREGRALLARLEADDAE